MSGYRPVKTKRKRRSDPRIIRMLVFRVIPIALVIIISIGGFTLFDKKISEIIAAQKYNALSERGIIDDPTQEGYTATNIDWYSAYSASDPNGFDPLELSPLGLSEDLRPSAVLTSTAFERALGYTNKQSKIWSLHDSVNSDICAWVYVPGLGINYPVAQDSTKGTKFYLTHSYDKTYSTSGAVFLSSASSINPLSKNLILNGHNMRDNTMFATLNNYLMGTRSYYDAHRYIFIDTLYGTYRYEIYSVYKTSPSGIYLRNIFASGSVFLNWCANTNNKGIFKDESTTFSETDRILTLATCDSTSNYRIVVHAKMVYPVPTDENEFVYNSGATGQVIDPSVGDPIPELTPIPADGYIPELEDEEFEEGSQYRVYLENAESVLRVRSGPGTSFASQAGLANGTRVTINDDCGDWVKITSKGGMQGYVLKSKLLKDSLFSYVIPEGTVSAPVINIITPAPGV